MSASDIPPDEREDARGIGRVLAGGHTSDMRAYTAMKAAEG